ncbi:hypothetical protein SAMN02982929_00527 [Saccharopolyspora kobensis]|uniref:Uncharacterized protein n=1 Tax=Saccharopolyspora kobensis TaxID=146035 RepID=A0A1H5UIV0_9PSEU|nr:hypothetical protein SAMN02982929_00527 [Saccharopolyspora kobensis]SFC73465.1 hypothetical protein SAMN05216506_1011543 [Saccharopolyspora kobensis]
MEDTSAPHQLQPHPTAPQGNVTQPGHKKPQERKINDARDHHCESRRGGAVNRGEAEQ